MIYNTLKHQNGIKKYLQCCQKQLETWIINISVNEFIKILLSIPTLNEQKKIGEFFNKLDRQIELEEQKLEKLEEQKKGYMQKIFSQELKI